MSGGDFIEALERRYGPATTWRRFRIARTPTPPSPRRAPSPRVRAVLDRWRSEERLADQLPF